jgi:hypothetical protein
MEIWDIVTPAAATRFARSVPFQSGFSLAQFLPDREIPGIKSRIVRTTVTRVTAKYREYNAETPIGKRPVAVAIIDQLLPPLSQKIPLTEWEQLQFDMARGLGFDDVINTVFDDIQHNVNAIRNRLELARGDLLTDGKFTLNENGKIMEADYVLANSHKPTAGILWSDTTNSTPLTDERAWRQLIIDDSGEAPAWAFTSAAVVTLLGKNAEYISAFWGASAGARVNLRPDQVNDVRGAHDLPPLFTYDTQVNVDGVNTRVVAANKFVLGVDRVGETQFGATAQALSLTGSKAVDFTTSDAPGIFAAAYKEVDPPTGWTLAAANSMPVLATVDGLVSASVTA